MSEHTGDTTVIRAVANGRSVAAERGWAWIAEGWPMFLRAPGLWIGISVVLILIYIAVNMVPIAGPFAAIVLQPVFAGGLMVVCAKFAKNETPEFGDLFAGFQDRFGVLATVGAIYLAGTVAILVVAGMASGMSMVSFTNADAADPAMGATILLAALFVSAAMLPLAMAVWFAAPLVVFQNQSAVAAMKASFAGCMKNMLPFLIYGVIGFVFAVLATIPLGLGWLVLLPVAAASVYLSYRDIYLS